MFDRVLLRRQKNLSKSVKKFQQKNMLEKERTHVWIFTFSSTQCSSNISSFLVIFFQITIFFSNTTSKIQIY